MVSRGGFRPASPPSLLEGCEQREEARPVPVVDPGAPRPPQPTPLDEAHRGELGEQTCNVGRFGLRQQPRLVQLLGERGRVNALSSSLKISPTRPEAEAASRGAASASASTTSLFGSSRPSSQGSRATTAHFTAPSGLSALESDATVSEGDVKSTLKGAKEAEQRAPPVENLRRDAQAGAAEDQPPPPARPRNRREVLVLFG